MAQLAAVLAGVTVTLVVLGLFRPDTAAVVRRRAQRLWLPAEEQEEDEPFATRVLRPAMHALVRWGSKLLPQRLVSSIESRLQTAAMSITAAQFIGAWVVLGIVPPVALLGLWFVTSGLTIMKLLLLGGWGVVGGYLPFSWLRRRAENRTRAINIGLPDAIDMIVTSVEAGLGIQQAMITVAEKFDGPIAEEFGRVTGETRVGRPRPEALLAMAARSGSRDATLFVRAINQAEEMGLEIGAVLRNQSAEIRERRHQQAREMAAKIPVKMTIPTILLMLPTLFILILTPVVLNAMEQFAGG